MRSRLVATSLATILSLTSLAATAGEGPCWDPGSADYAEHDCKVERLRARSFAVIAIVDDGINPYHVDFRLPADDDLVGVHPSEYIEGYPTDAARMQPSFDAGSIAQAKQQDADEWERAATGVLTWVDGTIIIGGRSTRPGSHFFEDGSHGTPVASQAAGRVFGPGHRDVLLVAVTGSDEGVEWAAAQPWIDAISLSWSRILPFGDTAEATWAAAGDGKIVCSATGNLTVPIWAFEEQGPSWHVHVGAVHASDRRIPYYSGVPADALGVTSVPAATHDSMTEADSFAGTSGATPAVCGLLTHTIASVRTRLGDTREGSRGGGVLAAGPDAAGAAADGVVTRREIEDAVLSTAEPYDDAPLPGHVRGGYGIVDQASVTAALEVLFGERPRPARDDADAWIATTDAARDAAWGQPPP